MDPRIQRTKNSIINAFIQLRSKKPLEKISIRELSQLAGINKATFYLHYHYIYDLSQMLESEIIGSVLGSIRHPEYFVSKPGLFVRELHCALVSQGGLLKTLFSGDRSFILAERLEQGIVEYLRQYYPQALETPKNKALFTYMVYGSYYAYVLHRNQPETQVLDAISEISETLLTRYPIPPSKL